VAFDGSGASVPSGGTGANDGNAGTPGQSGTGADLRKKLDAEPPLSGPRTRSWKLPAPEGGGSSAGSEAARRGEIAAQDADRAARRKANREGEEARREASPKLRYDKDYIISQGKRRPREWYFGKAFPTVTDADGKTRFDTDALNRTIARIEQLVPDKAVVARAKAIIAKFRNGPAGKSEAESLRRELQRAGVPAWVAGAEGQGIARVDWTRGAAADLIRRHGHEEKASFIAKAKAVGFDPTIAGLFHDLYHVTEGTLPAYLNKVETLFGNNHELAAYFLAAPDKILRSGRSGLSGYERFEKLGGDVPWALFDKEGRYSGWRKAALKNNADLVVAGASGFGLISKAARALSGALRARRTPPNSAAKRVAEIMTEQMDDDDVDNLARRLGRERDRRKRSGVQ
jgi:nucleotide-binding universal stress UspA family protein